VDPRAGLDRCGNSRPTGNRSPDRPARNELLYRLSYPDSPSMWVSSLILQCHWSDLLPNNYSSTHNSRLLEEWLSRQADIELNDWPPRSPDLNTMNVNVYGDEENNAGNLA
jgi:hypothetical protein